jgi:mRNA interferase RelE/StbE
MSMYRVFLERAAERELGRLPARLHNRIIAAIQALAINPRPVGCRKLVGTENDWRIRVSDYRVVYEIDEVSREVHVNRVRHRREVYR